MDHNFIYVSAALSSYDELVRRICTANKYLPGYMENALTYSGKGDLSLSRQHIARNVSEIKSKYTHKFSYIPGSYM